MKKQKELHVTYEEMVYSNVAAKQGIENTPKGTREIINIGNTLDALNVIRELAERPVKVTSGYRSEKLNRAVGGASRSNHMEGRAADIIATRDEDWEAILTAVSTAYRKGVVSRYILEMNKARRTKWIHVETGSHMDMINDPGSVWTKNLVIFKDEEGNEYVDQLKEENREEWIEYKEKWV